MSFVPCFSGRLPFYFDHFLEFPIIEAFFRHIDKDQQLPLTSNLDGC